MNEKFANGSLVTYRVRDSFVPRTPDQITHLAQQYQMPASLVPTYAGDRAMAGRAIAANMGKAKGAGWLLQPLETSKTKVVYTLARIEKDIERERTDYAHETTIKWSNEGGNGHTIEGWHEIARACDMTYQTLRGMILAGDWTRHIIEYITGPCRGVAFLDSGSVYWVPPQGTQQLEALRAMLDAVGIGLMIGEIAPESHGDVQEVARGGLNEQLQALQEEVDAFDGTQPASVYRGRLARLQQLHATTLAYEEALGVKFAEARAVRAQVQAKVRDLLTVREQTIFHKDGTVETVARPPLASQVADVLRLHALGETAVAQALLEGRLEVNEELVGLDLEDDSPTEEGAPDAATLEALAAVGDVDPALALTLMAPTTTGDLPETF